MPTPTPLPDMSQLTQLNNLLHEVVGQGLVGAVQLVAFAIVLLATSFLVMTWFRRYQKPPVAPQSEAVNAMAQVSTNITNLYQQLVTQIKDDKQYQRQKDEENEKRRQEEKEHYLNVITAFTDSNNRLADNQQSFTVLVNKMVADNSSQAQSFQQLLTAGSTPLQGVAITTGQIKSDTEAILEYVKRIEERLQKQADCADITDSLKRLEELVKDKLKRETDSQPIVVIPQATVTTDDGGSGQAGEAA